MALTILRGLNEGTSCYLSAVCTNHAGTAITPTAVSYMIHDVTAGETILDWSSVTPGNPTVIHLTPNDTILLPGQSSAIRSVRVMATYGIDDQVTSEYLYSIHTPSMGLVRD